MTSTPTSFVGFPTLVGAEFHKARQTRSTVTLMTVFVAIALTVLVTHAMLNSTSDTQLGGETVTGNADIVGFAAFLAMALTVAKDHNSGTNDLLRTLTPDRPRHLIARATGTGLLALAAISIVLTAGTATVLTINPSALASFTVIDSIIRAAVTTFLLTWAGVGIGALTRSSASATFTVLTLYWLLPIALVMADISGAGWAGQLSEITLGFLAANSIATGPESWGAVGGVAAWAAVLMSLGILREMKGN